MISGGDSTQRALLSNLQLDLSDFLLTIDSNVRHNIRKANKDKSLLSFKNIISDQMDKSSNKLNEVGNKIINKNTHNNLKKISSEILSFYISRIFQIREIKKTNDKHFGKLLGLDQSKFRGPVWNNKVNIVDNYLKSLVQCLVIIQKNLKELKDQRNTILEKNLIEQEKKNITNNDPSTIKF